MNTYSNDNKSKKSNLKSFTAGALTVALIGTGAWALSKDSKTGEVRIANWINGSKPETISDDQALQDNNYGYDYTGNVVTVTTPEPTIDPNATYAYDFEKTSKDTTIPVTAVGQPITNPIVNEELPANIEYVDLTTEAFEKLTTSVIKELESKGLKVSHEDVVKYTMIRNIDKLKQDNNQLVANIIGNQDITEVLMDGVSVIDAIRNYNLLYFDKYHTTDGFISATLGVFDEVQNARAAEFERRVYELGANYQNETKFNELTYTLLRDLYNPLNPISQLEDGVSYGVELIDMYMVRATFGTDRYIKLNNTNADLIKYFVSFAGDGDEYEDNALMNGNLSNVYRTLEQCTNTKTLTK